MKLTKIGTAIDVLKRLTKEHDYKLFTVKNKSITLSNALEALGLIVAVIVLL